MKVKVRCTVERFTEIEIPDELANIYKYIKKANYEKSGISCDNIINEYVNDVIMKQPDVIDWFNWEEID